MQQIRDIILLFTSLIIGFNSISQNYNGEDYLLNIFPVSPETAALGTYGNIGIEQSCGKFTFQVPLYTIKAGNFEMPISLNYGYSGFMVGTLPTKYGLGWNLNAGGVITREVKGLPDDIDTYPYKGYLSDNIGLDYVVNWDNLSEAGKQNLVENSARGDWDAEPDKFYISVGNLSASFYFNENAEAVFIPYRNYSIEIINYSINNSFEDGFILTDDLGNKYYFTKTETVQKLTEYYFYISGWHLSSIELANNMEISFEYNQNSFNDYLQKTVSQSKAYLTYEGWISCSSSDEYNFDPDDYYFSSLDYYSNSKKYLEKIIFPEGEMQISDNTISVNDYLGNEKVKFKIYQSNFCNNETYKKIERITKFDNGGAEKDFYVFEYWDGVPGYNTAIGDPSAFNFLFQQDYFGFYNNPYPLNNSLIPGIANRIPNFNSSRVGAMKRIIYQTGGYSEIIYEPNKVNGYESTGLLEGMTYTNDTVNVSASVMEDPTKDFPKEDFDIGYFTINTNSVVYLSYGFNFFGQDPTSCPFNVYCTIEVKRQEGVNGGCQINQLTYPCNHYTNNRNVSDGTFILEGKLYLEQGTYELSVYVYAENILPNGGLDIVTSSASLFYYNEDLYNDEVVVSGIRVKEIKGFSSLIAQEPEEHTIYNYNQLDGKSSGKLVYPLNYTYFNHIYVNEVGCTDPHSCCYPTKTFMSHSSTTLNSFNNSPVFYERVEKINRNEIESGKSVSNFTSEFYINYLPPFINASGGMKPWKFGKTDTVILVNKNNNEIKRTISAFSDKYNNINPLDPETRVYGLKVMLLNPGNWLFDWEDYAFQEYSIIAQDYLLAETEEIDSFENGDEIHSISNYEYDDNTNYLKESEDINSKGESIKTTYFYPYEYSESLQRIQGLIDNNIIAKPIKTEKILAGNQTSGTVILLNDFGLPDSIYNYETTVLDPPQTHDPNTLIPPDYNKKAEFLYYDNGKLKEFIRTDDITVCVLWGYNNNYIVAKIENATYDVVVSNLGCSYEELQQKTDIELRAIFENLRDDIDLPNAMITSYTYKPLVGMKTETDPAGKTIFYDYDDFNRLETIKDQDGNIIKHIDYNYKTQ